MNEAADRTPDLTIVSGKITGYLLNLDHRKGRHKARWFIARGYDPTSADLLVSDLFKHGRPSHLVRHEDDAYGRRYVYEGPLETPDGSNPRVRSIWQRPPGDERRFFVTAYPI